MYKKRALLCRTGVVFFSFLVVMAALTCICSTSSGGPACLWGLFGVLALAYF